MAARIISELFATLDGVVSGPDKWHGPYFSPAAGERTEELLASAGAMLLGRNTYLEHAGFWPTASGRMADLMNEIPKIVVTSTLDELRWQNSTRLDGDVLARIAELKGQANDDIAVTGSVALVRSLLRAGLLDQLRLILDPVVVGQGVRLFEMTHGVRLRLAGTEAYDTGAVALTYDVQA